MYHRWVVSRGTFAAVDNRIYWKLRRWCGKRQRNKSWTWIKKRYFQPAGDRSGVFSGVIRDSKGRSWPIQLMAAQGVKTLGRVKIRSEANPYDPAWDLYLEERAVWKLDHALAGRERIGYRWKEQGGKCRLCGQRLQEEDQPWHRHHRVWRCPGGQDTFDNLELLHANCHRQLHAGKRY